MTSIHMRLLLEKNKADDKLEFGVENGALVMDKRKEWYHEYTNSFY